MREFIVHGTYGQLQDSINATRRHVVEHGCQVIIELLYICKSKSLL